MNSLCGLLKKARKKKVFLQCSDGREITITSLKVVTTTDGKQLFHTLYGKITVSFIDLFKGLETWHAVNLMLQQGQTKAYVVKHMRQKKETFAFVMKMQRGSLMVKFRDVWAPTLKQASDIVYKAKSPLVAGDLGTQKKVFVTIPLNKLDEALASGALFKLQIGQYILTIK